MKEKFKNIELLRFIFAVLIIMFHFRVCPTIRPIIEHALPGLYHCNVCVDFFFIMAGFFLFNTINTTQPTFEFAQKRFFRLAPLLWLFIFFQYLLSITIHTSFSLDGSILKLLLLHNIGFAPNTGGPGSIVTWFISAIFWTSLFYFYITKIIDKKYLNLVISLITICSLGLLLNYSDFNTGGNTTNIYYFINTGILRGLYGIGIGYFISMLYKSNFLKNCSKKVQYLISFLEIFCIGFLTHFLLSNKVLPGKSGFLYIVIFSILFYLFLIKKGIISKLLNNDLSVKLGAYSYAIYVMHPLIGTIFNKYIFISSNQFIMNHIKLFYTSEILTAIIFSIIIHHLFEKPINKLISIKLAKNKVL